MTAADMVEEFHREFGLPVRDRPLVPNSIERGLRVRLQKEETEEFERASVRGDLVEVADGLADIVYVAYGAALVYGIDLDAVVAEVHRSNMTKLQACADCQGEGYVKDTGEDCPTCDGRSRLPLYRHDGKVLKGDDFERPDILGVLQGTVPA